MGLAEYWPMLASAALVVLCVLQPQLMYVILLSPPVVLVITLWALVQVHDMFHPTEPEPQKSPEFRIRRFYVTDKYHIAEVEA